jgi:hypothetical protein
MRYLTAAAGIFVVALIGMAPGHTATTGRIEGRVENAATGKLQSGVRITVSGIDGSGESVVNRSSMTGSNGRYAFDHLPTGEEIIYALDAHYKGGLYAGRPISLPSDTRERPVIDTTLRVWEPTSDPAAVIILRDNMFVVPAEGGVAVIESVTIVNQTDFGYVGRRGGQMEDSGAPSFGFALPPGAEQAGVQIRDSTLDIPALVSTDFGFGITAAIPPDETRVTFSYHVPGRGGSIDLSRNALYATAESSVYAALPLQIESNRLHERGQVTLSERTYTRWTTRSRLDAGDPIQVVARAEARFGPGLIAGIIAAVVLALAIGMVAFLRARRLRGPKPPPRPDPSANGRREQYLREIAELDISYSRGAIGEQEWISRRKEIKSRLDEETGSNR